MAAVVVLWLALSLGECDGARGRSWWVCARVASTASVLGADARLVVALAWSETRFRGDLVSSVGAVGPLQIVPRWWCPSGDVAACDTVAAGVRALTLLTAEHGEVGGLCHYACGTVCRPGCARYARHIVRARRIGWRAAAAMIGE